MRVLAVYDDPNDLRYVRDALVEADYATLVTGARGGSILSANNLRSSLSVEDTLSRAGLAAYGDDYGQMLALVRKTRSSGFAKARHSSQTIEGTIIESRIGRSPVWEPGPSPHTERAGNPLVGERTPQ